MSGQIVELLSAIGAEVGAVGKQGRNEQQNYSFRGIDHIMNAAAKAFHKHKVVVSSAWMDVQEEAVESARGASGYRVTGRISFTFTAPDGSTVVCVTRGEAIDYGDKATNKAHSAAKKYALVDVLSLPTDEPDADEFSHDLAPREYRSHSDKPSTGNGYNCPSCGSQVWDNTNSRRDDKDPVWKCSNNSCQGGSARKKGDGNWPWASWEADPSDAGLIGPAPIREDYTPRDDIPEPELKESDDPTFAPF